MAVAVACDSFSESEAGAGAEQQVGLVQVGAARSRGSSFARAVRVMRANPAGSQGGPYSYNVQTRFWRRSGSRLTSSSVALKNPPALFASSSHNESFIYFPCVSLGSPTEIKMSST